MESDLVLACELISCTQELTCELVRQLVDENSPAQRRALGERVMTYQGFINHMQAQIRNEYTPKLLIINQIIQNGMSHLL